MSEQPAVYKIEPSAIPPDQERHDCPSSKWKGFIVTDKGITGVDFIQWYQSLPPEDAPSDGRPRGFVSYELRRHFIKAVHFPDIAPAQWEGDGRKLPMQVLLWVNSVTSQLLAEAQDPNA